MTRHQPLQLLTGLALLSAGCAGPQVAPYDPFKLPRAEFYGSLHVVAVAPLSVPSDLEDPEPVKAKFIAMIEQQLQDAGFQVVSASSAGPIVEAAAAEKGGIFDPVTGKVDEAKAKAVLEDTLLRLRAGFNADALLRPYIRVVNAKLSSDTAVWDGTSEYAGTGFWKRMLTGSHSGRVPALSLIVRLVRVDGRELYANAGGLRVISRVGMGGKAERIPHAELFGDDARNANAVHLALDPLLGKKPPP